jgi:hypothetical protein
MKRTHHSFEARSTQAINCQARSLYGAPALQSNMPGEIGGVHAGKNCPKVGIIHQGRVEIDRSHALLARDDAEFRGAERLEGPPKPPERGPFGGEDDRGRHASSRGSREGVRVERGACKLNTFPVLLLPYKKQEAFLRFFPSPWFFAMAPGPKISPFQSNSPPKGDKLVLNRNRVGSREIAYRRKKPVEARRSLDPLSSPQRDRSCVL